MVRLQKILLDFLRLVTAPSSNTFWSVFIKNDKKKSLDAPIAINKKARFNYEIVDEIEAGIALNGSEIKSVRERKVNIVDSFATIKSGELFLINLRIEPYSHASHFNHEPTRSRKLLLKRKEIDRLHGKLKEKGIVVVPLKLYLKRHWVKVLLGLGKGKKLYDKRRDIKDKDMKREMQREMKKYL